MDRIEKQIQFIFEIDKLKTIIRRSYITGGSKLEDSAEHSWHVSALAIVVAEHADERVDICRVVKMLLFHDVVEIDAGDTYFFDSAGAKDKAERETKAADRLFSLLPEDQARELRGIWEEYEERATADARFAYSLDRFIPLLHNYHTRGRSWKEHDIALSQVMELRQPIEEGSRTLWDYAESVIKKSVEKGYLRKD